MLMRLGLVKVSLNNTHFDFAEIPVPPGEQIRVVKMEALEKGAGEFTMVAIRSEPSAGIRILEVGVFTVLTPEIMRLLRGRQDDRAATGELAHLTWYGQPTMIPPSTSIQTVQGNSATAGMVGGLAYSRAHGNLVQRLAVFALSHAAAARYGQLADRNDVHPLRLAFCGWRGFRVGRSHRDIPGEDDPSMHELCGKLGDDGMR